jgi:hypothetical protein
MNSATDRAIDVGIIRPLDTAQIRSLMRMRGPNRNIAGAALAAGMTVRQFKKLPPDRQREVHHAYMQLTAPGNMPAPPAGQDKPRQPSLRDFSREARIALGRRLLAVKAQLPRGHFGLWCEEKSGLKRNTIRVCMNMAEAAGPGGKR